MKIIISLLLAISLATCAAFGAAGDIKIPQRNPSGNAWPDIIFATAPNSLIGTNNTGRVGRVTVGTNLTLVGGTLSATGSAAGTTVGTALLNLVNPSAITFLRINADNSVTALSAGNYLTALGFSANGQSLVTAANYAAMRTLLDLEAGTDFLGYPTGTPNGTKFLRDDNSWQTVTGLSDGDKGDITVSGSGATFTIDPDPRLLRPNAAMGALAIDVTKKRNTKTATAAHTLTFSATPSAGHEFGVVLTGDSVDRVITIPSSYSLTLGATITSFTLKASSKVELTWVYDGTTYFLAGEPVSFNDISTVTPATGDYLPLYDVSGAVDGKATIANILALGGGGVTDGDKGDITVSSSGAAWTIDSGVTYTTPTLSGIVTTNGANITTANALGAFAIDVTKGLNTKTISADQTFTFTGTPAANTWFALKVTNSDGSSHTATIPSSKPFGSGSTITNTTIPASSSVILTWLYNGSTYDVAINTVAGSGSGDLLSTNNLSDVANAGTARTNLSLGNVDNTSDATKNAASVSLTNKTIVAPSITGIVTTDGANITTANALGAFAIDVTKGLNTKTISADQTFTFSGTPATSSTWFALKITNSDTSAHDVTIPSSKPFGAGSAIVTVPVPASSAIILTWLYNGSTYEVAINTTAGSGAGDLLAANNLSDVANAGTARTNLGLAIGTNVQAYDADLTTWAGVTPSANGQSLVASANYASMRGLLDLEAGTDFLGYPTGTPTGSKFLRDDNSWQTIAGGGDLLAANNLSDLANAGTARTNLGATTVGGNIFTLTNPSAITFLRMNADNTVTARSAANFRTDLSLVPGTDVQTYDADLTTYAGITPSANVQTLLGGTDFAAVRTSLGLVIGTNVQAYDADLTTYAGITPGAGVGTFLATPSSANLAAAVTGETGTGALVFGTSPTIDAPSLTGIITTVGAKVTTANAMGALAVDVTKAINTKTISADSTFTFSGTPATADTWFGAEVTNSDASDHTLTIPTSTPWGSSAAVTTITIPASSTVLVQWKYTGSIYRVSTVTTTTGALTDGDKGDITVSASGGTFTIDAGTVTLAKMADLAQDQMIVRTTASTGVPQTATVTAAARTVLDDTTVAAMVDTLGGAASSGTGGLVRVTSPSFTTPALGTPSAAVLTNATGLPTAGLVDGAVTLAKMANLAQDQFIGRTTASTGVPETATITSAARTVLDDTSVGAMVDTLGGATSVGTGGIARGTSPAITTSLTTPSTTFALLNTTATTVNAFAAATTLNVGAAATTVLNFGGSTSAAEFRFLEPSGSGTNYTALKVGAQSANITYTLPPTVGAAGTFLKDVAGDGILSWAAPAGGGDALTTNPLSQFAATTSAQLLGVISDETGTGAAVFATSPTLVTPALGTPSALVLTNATGLPTGGMVDAAVTLAKMANLAQDQFIVRTTASTGVPQTATVTAAARTVLDDTTVGAMVDTLGGASSSGTGGLARVTSPSFTTPALGAATATTASADDNDTSVATTAFVQTELTAYAADTKTLTNTTYDAGATGNVFKAKGYIYLTHPHLADGTNATIGTTATAIGYGHGTFSNSVDEASNYVEYYFQVPEDLDTAVALRGRLKVLLGGADTATHRYVMSSVSVADSAVPTASTLANAINVDFAGDGSGANGDVETSAWTTLTSWAGALTAGQTWRVRLARDGNASQDASTVNSTELGLVLEYGVTQ